MIGSIALPETPAVRAAAPPLPRRLLLVGNPNVGKSALFRALTGRQVLVSNFPGTTVEIARAAARSAGAASEVVDTPGINDLDECEDEARAVRQVLSSDPDAVVVQVADAKNLRRALLLTLQLAEGGRDLVLVLNMFDELEARGGRIDLERLAARLGVPVIATAAVTGRGLAALVAAAAAPGRLAVDQSAVMARSAGYERSRARFDLIGELLGGIVSLAPPPAASFGVRLGCWAIEPLRGLAILLIVMVAVVWWVGLLGAGTLVDVLEVGLFRQHVEPLAIAVLDLALPFPHEHPAEDLRAELALPLTPTVGLTIATWQRRVPGSRYELSLSSAQGLTAGQRARRFVHDLLVGEFGLVSMALCYALAVVLPIVGTFFLAFGVLEDSGYLARLAILVHRVFRAVGLDGRAVVPMLLGLGCGTMATLATRILRTRRERIVATLLLALAVPCSAQLGVLLAMATRVSAAAVLLWVGVMTGVFLSVGALASRLWRGERSELILELPPMRRPRLADVAGKAATRVRWYLAEIIPLFAIGALALFGLDRLGLLRRIASAAEPLVTGWLGLPAQAANALLVGFLRRDFGAVYLLEAATGPHPVLGPHEVLVAMVTITLFMPCVAMMLMIAREHGRRVAAATTAFVFAFAFLIGGLVHRLALGLGL